MAFNLRNFILNSNYPIDQVVGMKSGSLYMPANSSTATSSVAHGLPFTPLVIGTCSPSSTFTSNKDAVMPLYVPQSFSTVHLRTNGTNIIAQGYNNTASAITYYWRAILLEPSDSNSEVPFTNELADTFQFNTDYNYSKLVKSGVVTSNSTIDHNLGYLPQVMLWKQMSDGTYPLTNAATPADSYAGTTTVDSNNLYILLDGGTRIHYRIYGDD